MMEPLSEEDMSLTDAAQICPPRRGGKRPHVSCLYRWTKTGCRGVRLESWQCGGTRVTSREALERFFQRLSRDAGLERESPAIRTQATRERDCAKAERSLDQAGW